MYGVPGGIRTPDTRLRRPLLYPAELLGQILERMTGIEPALSAWEADVLPLNYIRNVLLKDKSYYNKIRIEGQDFLKAQTIFSWLYHDG